MANRVDNLKQNARKLRDDAVHTAEAVWTTAKDTVKTAAETAGDLVDRGRETAGDMVDTTRRTIQNARIKARELEEGARDIAVKAAGRVERVSHDLKKKQASKIRSARGKKSAVVKEQRAQAKVQRAAAKVKTRSPRTASRRKTASRA